VRVPLVIHPALRAGFQVAHLKIGTADFADRRRLKPGNQPQKTQRGEPATHWLHPDKGQKHLSQRREDAKSRQENPELIWSSGLSHFFFFAEICALVTWREMPFSARQTVEIFVW
jgi:hypothetical protein